MTLRKGWLFVLGALWFLLWDCTLVAPAWAQDDIFEVKATSLDSIFYRQGKIEKDRPGDEIVYQVNLSKGTVTRTAVYNKSVKDQSDSSLGGLQADNTVYQIVHNGKDLVTKQQLIKAIGQTGGIDGYETIVIGEDFVTTSRSTGDYFVLYHYKRTDPASERFRVGRK